MKKSIKRMVKAAVAFIVAISMFFSSLGQVVIAVQPNISSRMEITVETKKSKENFDFIMPKETLNCDIIPITTTTTTTISQTTTTTITTTTVVTTKITTKEKEIFIFKPDTHYIHTKNCHWVEQGLIEEITITDGIEARLCEDCCPNIEIINLYEEPIEQSCDEDCNEERENYTENYNEESINCSQEGYNLSDWDYTLLCRIVSSEYGSDWVPVEEKAKIVATVMNMVYSSDYPDTIEGVLDVSCAPWGFDKYYDYYMSDSIYAAVDYYFTSSAFNDWTCTSWSGDGTWNYFY